METLFCRNSNLDCFRCLKELKRSRNHLINHQDTVTKIVFSVSKEANHRNERAGDEMQQRYFFFARQQHCGRHRAKKQG